MIGDCLDRLDEEIHIRLKTIAEEKTLFEFGLILNNNYSLHHSNDGLRLTKEYNSIMER